MADFSDLTFLPFDHLVLNVPDDVSAYLDLTPPVATLLSPAPLAGITEDAAITIRVVDDRYLTRAFLWAEYPDGSSDVIYRDGVFLHAFDTYSTANVIGLNTMEFVIARGVLENGARVRGWPASPDIYVGGIDRGGNVS